jgi:hypothetical protein
MSDLSRWLIAGGVVQLAILIASALVPQVLDWRGELRKLPRLFAQLVWVHGAFIVLTITGFGLLSIGNSAELAAGTPLASSVCLFIAIFWGTRLAVQWCYFHPEEYLRSGALRLGYHLLTAAFIGLTVIYTLGAFRAR